MNNVKAIIKLATGNVGFYDNLTRIHLTIASPIAKVLKGMNTTNLENGVRCKTIEVIEGSLYDAIDVPEEEVKPVPPVEEPPKKEELPEKEESTEEEPVVKEEVEESVTEQPEKEEEATEPKKATRKRSSKKSKEEQSSTEESK